MPGSSICGSHLIYPWEILLMQLASVSDAVPLVLLFPLIKLNVMPDARARDTCNALPGQENAKSQRIVRAVHRQFFVKLADLIP